MKWNGESTKELEPIEKTSFWMTFQFHTLALKSKNSIIYSKLNPIKKKRPAQVNLTSETDQ